MNDPTTLRCYFCRAPATHIEIFDGRRERGYPGSSGVARLTCRREHVALGYVIALDRLGEQDWRRHLTMKRWGSDELVSSIYELAGVAEPEPVPASAYVPLHVAEGERLLAAARAGTAPRFPVETLPELLRPMVVGYPPRVSSAVALDVLSPPVRAAVVELDAILREQFAPVYAALSTLPPDLRAEVVDRLDVRASSSGGPS